MVILSTGGTVKALNTAPLNAQDPSPIAQLFYHSGSSNTFNKFHFRYFFVAGQVNNDELKGKLQAEIEEYGDMVLADNEDTYHNLVLKVLWILQVNFFSF